MTPLEKAQKVNRDRIARGEKIVLKTWTEKVKDKPKSLRFRINAKCVDDCCLGQREEVRKCTCKNTCPLWEIRPYR